MARPAEQFDIEGDQDGVETGGTAARDSSQEDLQEKLNRIEESFNRIDQLKNNRAEIQAEIQAAREQIVALGIPKKAFDMACAYSKMDEDQRKGFDTAYAIVRRAIGLPIQADLFEAGSDGE